MFQANESGATASTPSPTHASSPQPEPRYEPLRHMLFGSVKGVQTTIKHLHRLNYAEPNDWSKLIPTGQPNEVMAVLTKKVRV
ncbi:MAG: hypothetical protein F6K30_16285 [Cyanothece sp. SIO2G6]|nr:hypothetical protein [Cyanothece sp. SIO2G6]